MALNDKPEDDKPGSFELEELQYFAHLTTEQRTFYLYEVKCSRGKDVAKALIEALFLFLDSEK